MSHRTVNVAITEWLPWLEFVVLLMAMASGSTAVVMYFYKSWRNLTDRLERMETSHDTLMAVSGMSFLLKMDAEQVKDALQKVQTLPDQVRSIESTVKEMQARLPSEDRGRFEEEIGQKLQAVRTSGQIITRGFELVTERAGQGLTLPRFFGIPLRPFIGNETTKTVHKSSGCIYSSDDIVHLFLTLDEAHTAGYKDCRFCFGG